MFERQLQAAERIYLKLLRTILAEMNEVFSRLKNPKEFDFDITNIELKKS